MIKSNTIGIAADAFSKKKSVKQVRNPEYEEMIKIFNMSLECSNMPISDISDIPEYISVNTCVKIRFQGFFSDFKKILKPCGNNKTTIDLQTYDLICDLII
jgi:hypothetical protein